MSNRLHSAYSTKRKLISAKPVKRNKAYERIETSHPTVILSMPLDGSAFYSSQRTEYINEFVEEMHLLEIENRMLNFYQELKNISAKIGQYTSDELTEVDKKVTAIDTKWNTYYQAQQIIIAEDDSLLQIAANYQLAKQNLLDSIALQKHIFKSQKDFAEAETFFQTQDNTYSQLY